MLKRTLAILLCILMLLPMLVSCGGENLSELNGKEETETAANAVTETDGEDAVPTVETGKKEYLPQSQIERGITKILVLGNSHSNDWMFHMARIFAAQGFQGRYTLGFVYYSGCSMYQHVDFGSTNQAVYDYYESNSTEYTCTEYATLQYALEKHQWDMIIFQSGGKDYEDETMAKKHRDKLMELVDKYVPTEHTFAWHSSWPTPTEPDLWSDSWWRKPPAGYQDRMIERYNLDPVKQFGIYCDLVTKNIIPDERYTAAYSAGAAIMYANRILGMSEFSLYRDYTHLSDFGRILAAYTVYAQITGKPIEEVKLDKLPAKKRQAHYQADGDLILTDTLKEVIKECANYALENTWTIPGV